MSDKKPETVRVDLDALQIGERILYFIDGGRYLGMVNSMDETTCIVFADGAREVRALRLIKANRLIKKMPSKEGEYCSIEHLHRGVRFGGFF